MGKALQFLGDFSYVPTPSDTTDLVRRGCVLYCNTAGNVSVTPMSEPDGTFIVFTMVPGVTLPIRIKRLAATGTTATVVAVNGSMW